MDMGRHAKLFKQYRQYKTNNFNNKTMKLYSTRQPVLSNKVF